MAIYDEDSYYCQYCETYHKHDSAEAAQDFRENICKDEQ